MSSFLKAPSHIGTLCPKEHLESTNGEREESEEMKYLDFVEETVDVEIEARVDGSQLHR